MISGEMAQALDGLAIDMGTDPSGALLGILNWVLENDAQRARLALRIPARQKTLEVTRG
jgi:hypothetical protein